MKIADRVKALSLPMGEYVVVGSGTLDALGIRKAGDLDIAVTPKLFTMLQESGAWGEQIRYGRTFLEKDDVTIIPQLEWKNFNVTVEEAIDAALIEDGVPFLNLEHLRYFKQAMGREKDLKDIKMIDEFLDH